MINKKRKKKASFGFSGHIQGRFRPFLACFSHFWPISAESAVGRYDLLWPIRPNFGRISPVRWESKPIWHESSQVDTNRAELARIWDKQKKKKMQTRTNAQASASDAGAAPLVPRPCFLGSKLSILTKPSTLSIIAGYAIFFHVKMRQNIII